jgi:hypothetical protein
MTTAFRLGLPTDIPWQRVCFTEDMLDPIVCDERLPPKWQSSLAVFRYVPEEDYQLFPSYEISYLKVTATITGYQALEDEIQGQIDWNGVDISTVEGVTELLNSYFPCHGAILQVVVGPPGDNPRLDRDDYPFFLDFEPKKRELYEMATDTKERQSRSTETLQLTKSAGTAQSQEILDVDMGGSTSFGAEGSYAGTGGGFDYASSNQGQWGTKSLNTQQSQTNRTREAGQELRETYAFTTQISQMYHQLDSYHLGMNRAVFFVQPRPHVLEEPSGFVRGPRKVEGIQEFFLVVAKPKKSPEYCVSVRLDTSHLVETDIMDFETSTDVSDLASATARIPTQNDQPDGTTTREACFLGCWDVTYNCFRTNVSDDVVYTAPTGFSIIGWDDLVNQASHGSSSVSIAPGNKTLTVHAEANGHICFEGSGVCVDCPDEVDKWSGSARRQVQVRLRSDEPTRKVGTEVQLLITTRGLCCCDARRTFRPGVIGVYDFPIELSRRPTALTRRGETSGGRTVAAGTSGPPGTTAMSAGERTVAGPTMAQRAAMTQATAGEHHPCEECAEAAVAAGVAEGAMTIRQANAMTDYIQQRMVTVQRDPNAPTEPIPFVNTDVFMRQVESYARRSRAGRELLGRRAGEAIPRDVARVVAERTGKRANELTARDVLRFRTADLVRGTDLTIEQIAKAKQMVLGIPVGEGASGEGASGDATEAAKRRAQELGVELSTVEGTGQGGRITVGDVERAARANSGE